MYRCHCGKSSWEPYCSTCESLIERHFLTMADDPQRKHEVEITKDEARLLDLVPCGGVALPEMYETYWVTRGDPAGDNDFSWKEEAARENAAEDRGDDMPF